MKHKVKITVVIIHNNYKLYCIMIEKLIISETKTTVESTNEQIMVFFLQIEWNMFTECFDLLWFIECLPGYTGLNCSDKCPYPSYGKNCQGFCNCSEIQCDILRGCNNITSGNFHLYVVVMLVWQLILTIDWCLFGDRTNH